MKHFLFLLFLLVLVSCTIPSGPTVTFQTSQGKVRVSVELADTLDKQTKGLMERAPLPTNHGMLFLYQDEQQRIFWMKNMQFPIDIIFLNKDFHVVDIKENFQPCRAEPCEKYPSRAPFQYALEANAGFAKKHQIVLGEQATFFQPN